MTMKLLILIFLLGLSSANKKVGLNCSLDEDCDEYNECPIDSIIDPETKECVCSPSHCLPAPLCKYHTKRLVRHNATKVPGDCCDIIECVEKEINCSEVVCPINGIKCPNDSSPLPRRQLVGECCTVEQGCECLPCPEPSCSKNEVHIVTMAGTGMPGSCCPVYECQQPNHLDKHCYRDGKVYENGRRWEHNGCQDCECLNSEIICTDIQDCQPLPPDCPEVVTPPGQCCPVCASTDEGKPGGCKSSRGQIYGNGEKWEEDDCTTCECRDGGRKKCQAAMCHHNVTGTNLWPSHCPLNIDCHLQCENGFATDEENCLTCKCKANECLLECPNGYSKGENGEELCECVPPSPKCPSLDSCTKKCKHGFKTNVDGCPICKCDHCKGLSHCEKRCHHGFQVNSKGCSVCKCKPPPNQHGIEESSKGCNDGDTFKENGEVWSDGCRQCYCYHGKEMCSLLACPKLECPDAIVSKSSCCPVCPGNETSIRRHIVCYGQGGLKLEGETWTEGCADCICHNGMAMCHKEMCPPALCTNPIPPKGNECCPTCPQAPRHPRINESGCGDDRPAGSEWRQDSCVSCVCVNGVADCYTETCNQIDINCKHPIQIKNQCCPRCFDSLRDPNVCREGNVTFNVGDEWEQEKCRRCTCEPGPTIVCTQTLCDNPCPANKCCQKCKDSDGSGDSKLLYPILCFFVGLLFSGLLLVARRCCHSRDQLNICQAGVPAHYQYKNVPSYDNQTPSPVKSLV